MRVLTATSRTQGDRRDDHCFTTDGELVSLPLLECSCPGCGCDRSFAGLDSHRSTTTCAVAEAEVEPVDLRRAIVRSLAAQGWIAPLADDRSVDDVGPWGGERADDDEIVDDVVGRMRAVAEAFPAGTVLGREAGGVVVRGAPPSH